MKLNMQQNNGEMPLLALLVCTKLEDGNMYKILLQEAGVEVSISTNPYNALRIVENYLAYGKLFNIFITEYQLPGMNGIRLSASIKKLIPEITMMLLPTPFLGEREVKNEYETFGEFDLNPDGTKEGMLKLVKIANKKSRRPLP